LTRSIQDPTTDPGSKPIFPSVLSRIPPEIDDADPAYDEPIPCGILSLDAWSRKLLRLLPADFETPRRPKPSAALTHAGRLNVMICRQKHQRAIFSTEDSLQIEFHDREAVQVAIDPATGTKGGWVRIRDAEADRTDREARPRKPGSALFAVLVAAQFLATMTGLARLVVEQKGHLTYSVPFADSTSEQRANTTRRIEPERLGRERPWNCV
jgi:hypothetical protein